MAAASKRRVPLPFTGIEKHVFVARAEENSARGGIAKRRTLNEYLLHACIGLERPAFLNAYGCHLPIDFGAEYAGRLILNRGVDFIEEGLIIAVDSGVFLTREIEKHLFGWIVGFGKRVHMKTRLKPFNRLLNVTIFHDKAHNQPVTIPSCTYHNIAFGDIARVIRADKQVVTTLTLIRTGKSNISNMGKEGIIHNTQHRPRINNHYGAILGIDLAHGVGSGGVWC